MKKVENAKLFLPFTIFVSLAKSYENNTCRFNKTDSV